MNRDRSVLVLGAGVIGLTVAARLLEVDRAARVLVLEQLGVGTGATRFAGAIDIPYFQSDFHRRLVSFSWSWYAGRELTTSYRFPLSISWLLSGDKALRELRERLLDDVRQRPRATEPWRDREDCQVAEGRAFVLPPGPWCARLQHEITRSGRGRVLESRRVTALEPEERGVVAITSEGERFEAAHAFVCVGPWLCSGPPPWRQFARARSLRTKGVYGVRVELAPAKRKWQAVGWPEGGIFLMPHGRSERHAMSIKHDVWNTDPSEVPRLPPEVRQRAEEFLAELVGVGSFRLVEECAFMDTYGESFTPVVESLPGSDGRVTVVTGTHGSGVRLAPGLANEAVQCLQKAGWPALECGGEAGHVDG